MRIKDEEEKKGKKTNKQANYKAKYIGSWTEVRENTTAMTTTIECGHFMRVKRPDRRRQASVFDRTHTHT